MNKQKKIANELRALIKAPSVELSLADEELSSPLRKEFPCSQNAHNAILKLQHIFNKKS